MLVRPPTRPAGFGFQPVPLRYALTPSQPKPKRIIVPPKTQHWLVDQRGNDPTGLGPGGEADMLMPEGGVEL